MAVRADVDWNVIFAHQVSGVIKIVHRLEQERDVVQFLVFGLDDKGNVMRLVAAADKRGERCAGVMILQFLGQIEAEYLYKKIA